MRRVRSGVRPRTRTFAEAGSPGGSVLIARIVLALLLVSAVLVALLYGVGAFEGGPGDEFNLTGSDAPGAASAMPSSESS